MRWFLGRRVRKVRKLWARVFDQLAAQAPTCRSATADEMAEAIVFLTTDGTSFTYRAKLAVDGGRITI